MEADGSSWRVTWPDIVVIVGYLLCVLVVGAWSSWKSQGRNSTGYFLASRNKHWIPVGASLYASNIGSVVIVGLAGAGAATGIAVHGFEQAGVFGLTLMGWVFVPVYLSAGVFTMPEYLKLRFGGHRIRIYQSCLSLFIYTFTKIAADLYAGAIFLQAMSGQNSSWWVYGGAVVLVCVAGVFTVTGGLTTVLYTDLMQTVLMVGGSFILAAFSFQAVGGYEGLVEQFPYATASIQAENGDGGVCGEPPKNHMRLLRPLNDSYPWLGMTTGMLIVQIWYWCTDQVMVQRTLACKNLSHAKGAAILASYLKYLALWVMVLPGMAARILYPERIACASPDTCLAACGSERGCTNSAYPELILSLMPAGLRGLMLAVIMAALVSSLTSVFNSASTIFTMDIWVLVRGRVREEWRRTQPSDMELVVVGRLVVVVMVIISVIWVPIIQSNSNSSLFDYITSIVSIQSAPVCAIFLLAIFWSRATEQGAFWGLMVGMVMGLTRFVLEACYIPPPCGSGKADQRPALIVSLVGGFHYLHFCLLSWTITMVVAVAVSLLTPPIPSHSLYRLTFWSRHDQRVRQPLKEKPDPISNCTPLTEVASHNNQPSTQDLEDTSPHDKTRVQWWHRMARWVCGVKKEVSPTLPQPTQEEAARIAVQFLRESPKWKWFADINAVVCVLITIFVYGFYA